MVLVTNAVKHFKFTLRGKGRIHKSPVQCEIAALHPSAPLRGPPEEQEAAFEQWLADLRHADDD